MTVMTKFTFGEQLDRITGPQGEWPNAYGDEKKTILWDEYRSRSLEWFTQLVTEVIREGGRYAPTIKQVAGIAANIRERQVEKEKREHHEEFVRADPAVVESEMAKIRGMLNIRDMNDSLTNEKEFDAMTEQEATHGPADTRKSTPTTSNRNTHSRGSDPGKPTGDPESGTGGDLRSAGSSSRSGAATSSEYPHRVPRDSAGEPCPDSGGRDSGVGDDDW